MHRVKGVVLSISLAIVLIGLLMYSLSTYAQEEVTPKSSALPLPRLEAEKTQARNLTEPMSTSLNNKIVTRTVTIAGVDFIFDRVGAGTFRMGSPKKGDPKNETLDSNEWSTASVSLPEFWIGQTEVTNEQYQLFIDDHGYSDPEWWTSEGWAWVTHNEIKQPYYQLDNMWNKPKYPVVGITWYEALAFTRWLDKQMHKRNNLPTDEKIHLPSEAEWERAARGDDMRPYPWGITPTITSTIPFTTDPKLNYNYQVGRTKQVDCCSAGMSPYGAFNMAGNASEWTSTAWGGTSDISGFAYPYRSDDGRENVDTSGWRIIRGGSYGSNSGMVRSAKRDYSAPWIRSSYVGMRLAIDSPISLSISKTANPKIARSGEVISYMVILTNTGKGTPVTISDTLPPGLNIKPGISASGLISTNRALVFTGTIEAGHSVTITYQATVSTVVTDGSILFSPVIATSGDQQYIAGASVLIQSDFTHTLNLIYVSGDNNLSDAMLELFHNAEKAPPTSTLVTLLLIDGPEIGDAGLYHLKNLPEAKNVLCAVRMENPTVQLNKEKCGYQINKDWWPWTEATGTYASLKEFLVGALEAYPDAKQVTLSLVGHGGGWSPDLLPPAPSFHDTKPSSSPLGGFLWDDYPATSLSTIALGRALRDSLTEYHSQYPGKPRKFDLVYLDSCLMAMSEVAYELRDSVHYLLASENVSYTASRYDLHLKNTSGDKLPEEIGKAWIRDEASELRAHDGKEGYPFTYSLLNLEKMDDLRQKESKLADELTKTLTASNGITTFVQISKTFSTSFCFDSNADYSIDTKDYYCDLYGFAQGLKNQFPVSSSIYINAEALQNVITQSLVITEEDNPGPGVSKYSSSAPQYWQWQGLHGVSRYLPLRVNDWKLQYYSEATKDSEDKYWKPDNWDKFLKTYVDVAKMVPSISLTQTQTQSVRSPELKAPRPVILANITETQQLTGSWEITIEGSLAVLHIGSVDSLGNLKESTLANDPITGVWDSVSKKITFLRLITSPNATTYQAYTGFFFQAPLNPKHRYMTGSFEVFSNKEATKQPRVNGGWYASQDLTQVSK